MTYSISYKNGAGVTTRSECLEFAGDKDASEYARKDLARNALIEVWKGDDIVARLEQPAERSLT